MRSSGKPTIRVFSKWDVAEKGREAEGGIPLSSVDGTGMKELLGAVTELLPEGKPFYDEDYYTDQDPHTRVSEIIREKAFRLLSEEIPHGLYVKVEDFSEEGNLLKILAYVVLEKDSQKRIVIGKGGEVIQRI